MQYVKISQCALRQQPALTLARDQLAEHAIYGDGFRVFIDFAANARQSILFRREEVLHSSDENGHQR